MLARPLVADTPRRPHSLRFLLPLTLIAAGASLMIALDTRHLAQWLDGLGSWAPIAFIFAAVACMTMMVPKTMVSVTAGALFGTVTGSLLMVVIAVSAAALNYAIGSWWLHDSINRKLACGGQSDRGLLLRAVRDLASEAGFRFHLLIRLAPVPTTVISYAMGASGSRVAPFLLAAAVAVIPQTLWVHGGTAVTLVGQSDSSPVQWISTIISVLAAIVIGVVVPPLAIRRVETLRQSTVGKQAETKQLFQTEDVVE